MDDNKVPESKMPVIVELGKVRRKHIKRLLRGEGKLVDQVQDSLEELKTAGRISSTSDVVVFVVREKEDTPSWMMWPRL